MEERENEEIILKKIKKELDKNGIVYNDLSEKAKKMLINSNEFLEIQKEMLESHLKQAIKTKFDVQSFCEYAGIARATIYKKNKNGVNQYSEVIQYINSKTANFEAYKSRLITNLYKEKNEDAQLLNKLLLHEAEYVFMKERLDEQSNTIKRLEEEISTLNKTYKHSNISVN